MTYKVNINRELLVEQLSHLKYKAALLNTSSYNEVSQWRKSFIGQCKILNIAWVNEELINNYILEKDEIASNIIKNPIEVEYGIEKACRLIDRIIKYLGTYRYSTTPNRKTTKYKNRQRGNSLTSALHNARKSAKY